MSDRVSFRFVSSFQLLSPEALSPYSQISGLGQGLISQMFLPLSGFLGFCLPSLSLSSPSRSSNSPDDGSQPVANAKPEVAVVCLVTLFLQDAPLSLSTVASLSVEKRLSSGPFYSDSLIFNDSSSSPAPLLCSLILS